MGLVALLYREQPGVGSSRRANGGRIYRSGSPGAGVRLYDMTPTAAEASLIYLAVDAHGMAWAGKMVTNTPMRLEPRTGATREYPLLLRIQ